MQNYILECCVDSMESAQNAIKGGASRLELCANLPIGGTTPSLTLFRQIRRESDIKIHVLIRPRFGDFCYTDYEIETMCNEIQAFRKEKADAVVIGALCPDGTLNLSAMKRMIDEAGDMKLTLHRAFDMCKNPFSTLDQAVELGIHTILTSGQQQNSWKGKELLKKLISYSDGRIDIMAGGGVNAEVIQKLRPETGGTSYHMSGKITLDSPMKYRKQEVSMGLPSLSEYEIWRTSEENVQKAVSILQTLD